MVDQNQLAKVADLLKQAKTVLVLLPANPSVDYVATALGLFLSLEKAKKQVHVGCSTPMSVAFSRLFGVDKIKTQVGCRSLVISFPYVESAIEKVSYHVEGQKFNLVIVPKKGQAPLDPQNVSYANAGAEADVLIVVGAQRWEDLGELYTKEKDSLTNTQTIISLDNRMQISQFSTHNLNDNQASSAAEIAARLLKEGAFSTKGDIATNFLAGIEFGTNNLQVKTSADTFETIAWLMRKGSQRGHMASAAPAGVTSSAPVAAPASNFRSPLMGFPGSAFPAPNPAFPPMSTLPGQGLNQPQAMPPAPVQPNPLPGNIGAPVLAKNTPPIMRESEATDVAREKVGPDGDQGQTATPPSPDWYQPKIYRGKNLV
ncbi:hypothetical protein A2160_05490 [Candidatus Beckwithbacteria bacterium RBG_13_42_9]|uniref:DDH domain-containing protein n=1 Tax=Candidatus Beckwithbacteria bacterium RBG_13_42_9 TaxID=1797457 RepID=A0A1F5E359_9BACT|nr:MAG: hypothetical protein A2160_05490 [Candidatus Beckwithbacteria bacterium RBG_13_42_9]